MFIDQCVMPFFIYILPVTLIASETKRETESKSSKLYAMLFDSKIFERGGIYRPIRNVVLHFYIDKLCTIVLFMYMPVTLIASKTERETESKSSKFYLVRFDAKIFERGGVFID